MPRPLALASLLFLTVPAVAQTTVEPGEQAVIDANRAIREHNDKIAADNAAAQAAYREEVARVEAQRRANDASFAAASATFAAKQAQYEADMAAWRTESARVAAQNAAPRAAKAEPAAKPAKPGSAALVCRRDRMTGSNMPGKRVCRTQAEWERGG